MMASGITSKQGDQVIRLIEVAAGDSASRTLSSFAGYREEDVRRKIIEQGTVFQAGLCSVLQPLILEEINKLLKQEYSPQAELEKYFKEVYGYDISLESSVFPSQGHLPAYMAIPPDLDLNKIFTSGCSYFKIQGYARDLSTSNCINKEMEQERPDGLYVIAHTGGDDPERAHLEKSYSMAKEEGLHFLNIKEYLLVFFFHFFKYGRAMDQFCTTYTSSFWEEGTFLSAKSAPGGGKLYLFSRPSCSPFIGRGPRECYWED